MKPVRILAIFGTRPETIKMAPVITALSQNSNFDVSVCVTGQHREMLDQVMELFEIRADYDFNLMRPNQTLTGLTNGVMTALQPVLRNSKGEAAFDLVLVHGDTTTTMASALAAFHEGIAVGHVEAGLRSGNIKSPWPEEMNRVVVSRLARYHFAPTKIARENLLQEKVAAENVFVTGNTVIDALHAAVEQMESNPSFEAEIMRHLPKLDAARRMILVTGHRRENFGKGFERICQVLREIAETEPVEIVYPVHLNPNVQEPVKRILGDSPNIHLIAPQGYLPFISLMRRSYMIVTDSGGVQEEAPSLGKPVLVTRDTTERPEAIQAGTVRLVGTDAETIKTSILNLLHNDSLYLSMSQAINPYGDGKAAGRIVDAILSNKAKIMEKTT